MMWYMGWSLHSAESESVHDRRSRTWARKTSSIPRRTSASLKSRVATMVGWLPDAL
jgi:hypothetical protein